jgi:hypothetical protein
MIENSKKIYSITDLVAEAKEGFFPFRSRITIKRMAEKKIIPAHFTKIGKRYKNWWFQGDEIVQWMSKSKVDK